MHLSDPGIDKDVIIELRGQTLYLSLYDMTPSTHPLNRPEGICTIKYVDLSDPTSLQQIVNILTDHWGLLCTPQS